jgi:hypothetical protein
LPKPDEGVFYDNGRVMNRRRWTSEERDAVKAGVEKYGLGKWIKVKKEYAATLRNRTAVQLKDCYRTMMKHGEVGEVAV